MQLNYIIVILGVLVIKIIGSLVVRNEADRYLKECLDHMRPLVDDLFIFDDQSVDNTTEICCQYTEHVYVRADHVPSFVEHEGSFRQYAWNCMNDRIPDKENAWILSFDSDEFLVAEDDERDMLQKAVEYAEKNASASVLLHFTEIFKVDKEGLWYRTDGFWGKVNGTRLFKWLPNGQWNDKSMGCGSEPTYVSQGRKSDQSFGLNMLHLGYAKDLDKQTKYERYTSLYDHGHNDKHIQSIIQKPTLKVWEGKVPDLGEHFE